MMATPVDENFPCLFVDATHNEISEDSVITFWTSFAGDSTRSINLMDDTVPETDRQNQKFQVPRMPRRRQSLFGDNQVLPANPKPPQRRSTKSLGSASEKSLWEEMPSCHSAAIQAWNNQGLHDEAVPLPLTELKRKVSLERFQEEPQPRTSLGLPAVPKRQDSIGSLFSEENDEDSDIESLLASLPQD